MKKVLHCDLITSNSKMPLVDSSEDGERYSFRLRRIGIPATYPGIGNTFKINKEITVVGRNPSSDIFLDSKKNKVMISRLHAQIITEEDSSGRQTFSISDTSLNGTYVNDIKIADTCNLSPGDTVTFGHIRGAVLTPGELAQQPESEFCFKFEKYPATPPNEKQRSSEDTNYSPEFQRQQTPSPQKQPKPASIKTPLFPVAHIPDLSAFHTPGTPGYLASSWSTDNCRLHSPIRGSSKWQHNHASQNLDSDQSNDDLRAYAAAAADAMADSEEDIFSIRLPESPESYEKPGTFSFCANKQTFMNSHTSKTIQQPSQRNIREGTKRSIGKGKSPLKVASKRPRKHTRTYKKNSHKSTTSSDSDKDEDNLLYNSCSSVDCIHPHNRDKLVDWVQCDDCDDWYHVKCTGLTLESVRPKSAKFHCGCV